jgi:branched-chain amino acid transport system substrate-binding protein
MRRILLCACVFLTACPPRVDTTDKPKIEVKQVAAADADLAKARAMDRKEPKAKVEAYLLVRKTYPDSTAGQDALYEGGVIAFEQGDFVTARRMLSELVFENPLYAKADDARLKVGLAATELHAWRDAYQTLNPLIERLSGEDKRLAQEALKRAADGAQLHGDALKAALKAVDDAGGDEAAKKDALAKLEEVVESKATFLAIAEAWQNMGPSHPAWSLLTFKLARIYYHLRNWEKLEESLKSLLKEAPGSPYEADAKAMLDRAGKRSSVNPMKIGAVLPMTGKLKPLGEAVMRGVKLALKTSEIELVVRDSMGDVNLAGKAVEELAFDEQVIAVLGPLLPDDSRRAALVAEELQVPIMTMTRAEGITNIGPHVFRNMITNRQQADTLVDYATRTLGYKTFAVLYPNIPFGVEMTNEFWESVEKRGAAVMGAESYSYDQTRYTDEARKLVGRYYMGDRHEYNEALRELREDKTLDAFHKRKRLEKLESTLEPVVDFEALLIPDSWEKVGLVAPALAVEDIITNACDPKDLEKIKKTTGKKDLKTVTLLGPSTWSSPKGRSGSPELVERGGKFVACSIYVDGFYEGSNRKATKSFVSGFHKEYGADTRITLLDAIGYDTAAMLRLVVEKGKPKDRNAFTSLLGGLKGYEGATGTLAVGDNREAQRELYILTIDSRGNVKEVQNKPRPEG